MDTPKKGKTVQCEGEVSSPRNFRWTQQLEDTLVDLLITEMEKGNRPGGTFTSAAYRNVLLEFNRIHGTTILKKHVLSRIKTMKSNFVLFHGAFNGLSGFSWNNLSKTFEAEDEVWEERMEVIP